MFVCLLRTVLINDQKNHPFWYLAIMTGKNWGCGFQVGLYTVNISLEHP